VRPLAPVVMKETMQWSWRHPVAAPLEGIRPFLKWLAWPVKIGSRASYRHWQQGSTTQEYRAPPIRAEGVDLVSPMEFKLQHIVPLSCGPKQ
jgi:hypothetical protein